MLIQFSKFQSDSFLIHDTDSWENKRWNAGWGICVKFKILI